MTAFRSSGKICSWDSQPVRHNRYWGKCFSSWRPRRELAVLVCRISLAPPLSAFPFPRWPSADRPRRLAGRRGAPKGRPDRARYCSFVGSISNLSGQVENLTYGGIEYGSSCQIPCDEVVLRIHYRGGLDAILTVSWNSSLNG